MKPKIGEAPINTPVVDDSLLNKDDSQDVFKNEVVKNTKDLSEITKEKYFEVDLGHRKVQVRKWKAKDRKNFIKIVKNNNFNNSDKIILDTLVFSCLKDKNIALSYDELQYLFMYIRAISISDDFKFEYKCPKCNYLNVHKLKISKIIKPEYKDFEDIILDDIKIKLQLPPNAEFYYKKIFSDDYDIVFDLALYTKSLNDIETLSFDELVDFYENLDTDIIDKLLSEFNKMRFTFKNDKTFTCKECKTKTTIEFDEIPDFFPESWIK